MMAKPDLDRELDRLYALPLAKFIGARNELVKRLKAAGEPAAAARVKALAKPSVTAWAVNTLFHQERERFDALLAAAAAVRAGLAGKGDRRRAEAEKRQATRALLRRAAKILAGGGHAATPANRQRIGHTLEALAARDPEAEGPLPGRLTADLEPQGFDVLAGLAASLAPGAAAAAKSGRPGVKKATARAAGAAPRTAGSRTRARAKARDKRLEAARRKLAEHEAALARLEHEAEEAETAAAAAAERAERLAEEAAEARRLASAAEKAAAAAKDDLAAARAAATKARAARRRGLTRVAAARRQVERHEG